jgi:hypothetical protein
VARERAGNTAEKKLSMVSLTNWGKQTRVKSEGQTLAS